MKLRILDKDDAEVGTVEYTADVLLTQTVEDGEWFIFVLPGPSAQFEPLKGAKVEAVSTEPPE